MTNKAKASSVQQKRGLWKTLFIAAIVAGVLCVLTGSGVLYYAVGRPLLAPKTTVILEPDRTQISTVTQADLEKTAQILRERWRALGYGDLWASFTVSDNGQIIGQIPTHVDSEFIHRTKAIGVVEFVDFGKTPIAAGTIVSTDFDYDYLPKAGGTKWHTIMTNDEIQSIYVSASQSGGYEIPFALTEKGKEILADYSARNVNNFLGILLDKVVISSPRITSPITDGYGVINGEFTRQAAQIFAAIARFGPLPIPLK